MGFAVFSFSGGGSLGMGFQDRCEPIPGRCGANILFATLLKPHAQRSTFDSQVELRTCFANEVPSYRMKAKCRVLVFESVGDRDVAAAAPRDGFTAVSKTNTR